MRAAVCAALALAAACGRGDAPARTHAVAIRGFAYAPDTVVAAPGDTVVWTNGDVVPHTATVAGRWDTGEIRGSASGRIVAGEAGTYAYVCAFHPTMRGTLVVR
ncbi:MAG TPA: cupredoxin family copper-binding protein [Longimicrobium sp.]|jgi:plastocyanin|nr:cupredoxin family copper-binding protein [Longimicrobium sp.]